MLNKLHLKFFHVMLSFRENKKKHLILAAIFQDGGRRRSLIFGNFYYVTWVAKYQVS